MYSKTARRLLIIIETFHSKTPPQPKSETAALWREILQDLNADPDRVKVSKKNECDKKEDPIYQYIHLNNSRWAKELRALFDVKNYEVEFKKQIAAVAHQVRKLNWRLTFNKNTALPIDNGDNPKIPPIQNVIHSNDTLCSIEIEDPFRPSGTQKNLNSNGTDPLKESMFFTTIGMVEKSVINLANKRLSLKSCSICSFRITLQAQ